MTQLAIIGHKTRGKEVIEILEMLGYNNLHNYVANCDSFCFYGGKSTNGIYYDWVNDCFADENVTVFALEEFLEKFPYKVGDKVVVKGLSEYPKSIHFMKWFDDNIHYSFDNETWFLPSALNLYKEETMEVKCIAIKGHKTRYKEVIELLEMLGGKNEQGHCGHNPNIAYYISHKNTIICDCAPYSGDVYTLEEFLEKFPYKIGDRVSSKYLKNYKIEKMEWEDTNNRVIYKLQGMGWYNASELQPYKEETMEEKLCIGLFPVSNGRKEIIPCNGYEVVSDGGKFYVVKKSPQYPKTYEECAKIMNCPIAEPSGWLFNFDANIKDPYYRKIDILMGKFTRLLICRDAYWKIAEEQIGLDKPWKPDWLDTNTQKYCIYYVGDEIKKQPMLEVHHFLAFPTKEMSDAFYENFKDLIESCKKLL